MRAPSLLLLLALPTTAGGQAILNVERLQQTDEPGFSARVMANVSLTSGNTEVLQLGSHLGAGFLKDQNWVRAFGGAEKLREGSDEILDNRYAHFRYNRIFSDRLRSFHFLQLQTNQNLFLKRRFLLGTGLRSRLLERETATLEAGSGIMFEAERLDAGKLEPGEEARTEVLRMANLLVGSGDLGSASTWTTVLYYQPALEDFSDYRLSGEAGLAVKLATSVELEVAFTWRHDSRAPNNLEEDDLGFKTGIALYME